VRRVEAEQTVTGSRMQRWGLAGLFVALFALLTWPVWRWLWSEWNGNDYYSHGVLIPPVALYLAWRRIQLEPTLQWQTDLSARGGLAILGVSLGLYLYFLDQNAYYLATFAMIGLLMGLLWLWGGRQTVSKLGFPLGYLLLMTPLPFVERATLPLALFTGVCSTGLVKLLGLPVTIVGNAVSLPNADLVIGAQCSGINSIIALTSLNTLVAYVVAGPLVGRVALVVLAVPIAMLGNILRVANLLFVAQAWGAEAAFRFYHDYSGIVFFVLVLLMLIPLIRLLRCHRVRVDVI
jgi:exosortase